MWEYEKKLQYPVKIKNPNPKLAKFIITQYGGLYSICLYYKKTGAEAPLFIIYFSFSLYSFNIFSTNLPLG